MLELSIPIWLVCSGALVTVSFCLGWFMGYSHKIENY